MGAETGGRELMNEDWQADGLCRGLSPEEVDAVFFPGSGAPGNRAKRICSACPVQQTCLEYALEHRIVHGVWGGTSERERRRMLKERSPLRLVS